jgi:hypothetical protein
MILSLCSMLFLLAYISNLQSLQLLYTLQIPTPIPIPQSPSPHIRPPLHHHPARRYSAHNQRARQSFPQLRRPINQPLQRKVSESDPESPEGDFVHGRVVDVVGAVEADDGAESRPGAECAGAEGGD